MQTVQINRLSHSFATSYFDAQTAHDGLGKVPANLAGDKVSEKLSDKIDEKLGDKVSPELKDALKGLFKR